MTLLQVLSEKAKETREQIARTVQVPTGAAALPKIDQLGRQSELRNRSPQPEQELADIASTKPVVPQDEQQHTSIHTDSVHTPAKPEDPSAPPLPSHVRLALLAVAAACVLYTHLEPIVRWLKNSSFGLLDVVALLCLIAAAPALPRAQIQQSIRAVKLQIVSAGVAVKALPQMSMEMSAMLEEIRAMRRDVGGMAKKAAWLPGS